MSWKRIEWASANRSTRSKCSCFRINVAFSRSSSCSCNITSPAMDKVCRASVPSPTHQRVLAEQCRRLSPPPSNGNDGYQLQIGGASDHPPNRLNPNNNHHSSLSAMSAISTNVSNISSSPSTIAPARCALQRLCKLSAVDFGLAACVITEATGAILVQVLDV